VFTIVSRAGPLCDGCTASAGPTRAGRPRVAHYSLATGTRPG